MSNYLKEFMVNAIIIFLVTVIISLLLKNSGVFVNWLFVIAESIISSIIISAKVFIAGKHELS